MTSTADISGADRDPASRAPYRANPHASVNRTCDAKCTRVMLAVIIPILSVGIIAAAYLVYVQFRRSKKEQQAQKVEEHVREKLGEIGQSRQDLRNVDWEEATLEGSVRREGERRASVSDTASSLDGRSMTILPVDASEIGVARSGTMEREVRV